MPPPTDRREILAKLRAQVDEGRPIVGAGAGTLDFFLQFQIFNFCLFFGVWTISSFHDRTQVQELDILGFESVYNTRADDEHSSCCPVGTLPPFEHDHHQADTFSVHRDFSHNTSCPLLQLPPRPNPCPCPYPCFCPRPCLVPYQPFGAHLP